MAPSWAAKAVKKSEASGCFVVGAALIKVACLSVADKCATGLSFDAVCLRKYNPLSDESRLRDLSIDTAKRTAGWKHCVKVVNKSTLNGNADGTHQR